MSAPGGMQCVVLAGGLATRLLPLTGSIPKALLDVEGRPFLDWQLAHLARGGVSQVVLSVGHLAEQIAAHLQAHPPPLPVRLVEEKERLGTAGALRLCLDQGALDERFLLTWGDSYLPMDFRAAWAAFRASGKPALMTVLRNEGQWDQSNVVLEGGRLALYDKRRALRPAGDYTAIDYGLMALERAVVAGRLPPGHTGDLADLFHALSLEDQLAGFEVRERFYEIGSKQGLEDFRTFVRQGGAA